MVLVDEAPKRREPPVNVKDGFVDEERKTVPEAPEEPPIESPSEVDDEAQKKVPRRLADEMEQDEPKPTANSAESKESKPAGPLVDDEDDDDDGDDLIAMEKRRLAAKLGKENISESKKKKGKSKRR